MSRATYTTVAGAAEAEIEVKKSRFIGAAAPVGSEADARAYIQSRRKVHYSARHHCTAYVLGAESPARRSSDDGEPAGTAGVPILEILTSRGLTDTVIVVTRYFGGTLLGAGGLIRAYGSAAAAAVTAAGLVENEPAHTVAVTVDHTLAGRLDNELRRASYRIENVHYAAAATFDVLVPDDELAAFDTWLADRTGGRAHPTTGSPTYLPRPA